ncbi:hypothetical protein ACIPSA_39375 [Streptomyces sp. NPDC086549]|uniref:hypothetical protein n=1 Tax=Streptomyces sp. NPDC086549 TaxID=3365752 RepID=UPI00381F46D3
MTALAVAVAVAGPARAGGTPEADLEYHGSALMVGDRMGVTFTPGNHGPSAVADASVQLRWSVPLADRQSLPDECVRAGERVVVCRTGALPANGSGKRIELGVLLKSSAPEVTVEIDTAWSEGTVDGNRSNDKARVMVLETGDSYVF